MPQPTKEESQRREINKINKMTHLEMCKIHRFTPAGHPYFNTALPYYRVFNKRFKKLGGMTPEISKQIGWEQHA